MDETCFAYLWDEVTQEQIEEIIFALTYTPHGGGGLTWNKQDALNTDFDAAIRYLERLEKKREREAQMIRDAHRRGGKR